MIKLCYCDCRKVGLLEIKEDQYRMVAVPLKTVRPFKMADFKLSEYLVRAELALARCEIQRCV